MAETVNSPQVRGNGVAVLVHVLALGSLTVADKTHMGVSVNKAGVQTQTVQVDIAVGNFYRSTARHLGYLSVLNADIAAGYEA